MTLSNNLIYADYNANVPLRDCAKLAMNTVYDIYGNASAIHKNGQILKAKIETARNFVSKALGNVSGELIFTSCATEAAQLAIESAKNMGFDRICVGSMEHDCVFEYAKSKFEKLDFIPVDHNGVYDTEWLEDSLDENSKPLVMMMAVNNETGVVQPIKEAANLVHSRGGAILVDAVQALGKIETDNLAGYCDWLFVSGHKIGGPIGVGSLLISPGITPYYGRPGGGQEKGLRSGSMNAAAISAFGEVLDSVDFNGESSKIGEIRDWFESQLVTNFPNVLIVGKNAKRAANTSCFSIPSLRAEQLVIFLDLAGIAVSSGSACSSGSSKISRAISALNLSREISSGFIRVSFGYKNSLRDAEEIISALQKAFSLQARRAA